MSGFFESFHFLRPAWLFAGLPLALLWWWLRNRRGSGGNWSRAIAPELLSHLLDDSDAQRRRDARWSLLAWGWLLSVLALAGPAWEKLPQPVLQTRAAVVIVLDLSLSMYAEDIAPSRLQRARFKIRDLLDRRDEGLTGLVVYAGDAHVVAPLTDDTATIANLLPALSPELMPQFGSDPVAGVGMAVELLQRAEATSGRVLLITDGIQRDDVGRLQARLDESPWELSVLGVGTEQGAPVRLGDALLRDAAGTIVVPQLDRSTLQATAAAGHGRYSDLSLGDDDLNRLLPERIDRRDLEEVARRFDQWRERGPLLVILLLPFAALAARRGWLIMLPLLLMPLSHPSQALEWRDLWARPDQQGQRAFQKGNMAEAARRFDDPAWRGSAAYRAGDYQTAAEAFAAVESAEGRYNQANALTQAGHYRQALAAYDEALAMDPGLSDARANRKIAAELLRRQIEGEGDAPEPQQPGSEQQPPSNGSGDGSAGDGDAGQQGRPSQQTPQQPAGGTENDPRGGSRPTPDRPNADEPRSPASAEPGQASRDARIDDPSDTTAPTDSAGPARGNRAATADQRPTPQPRARPGKSEQVDGEAHEVAGASQGNGDGAARDEIEVEVEGWLRRIPDDPAGLLRRKFRYESQQRAADGEQSQQNGPLW